MEMALLIIGLVSPRLARLNGKEKRRYARKWHSVNLATLNSAVFPYAASIRGVGQGLTRCVVGSVRQAGGYVFSGNISGW